MIMTRFQLRLVRVEVAKRRLLTADAV